MEEQQTEQQAVQPGVQPVEVKTEEGIVHRLSPTDKKRNLKEILLPAGIILAIIFAGTVTGYFLANRGVMQIVKEGATVIQGPKEAGIEDIELFPDTAEGKIEINDSEIITEGSHKLIRPGGESQTAYLTSSVVDLNQFLGKCVQVWGETFAGQQAGWLMDIGRVKVLDKCPEGL